ncbi:bifunctional pyr operon transcriptional regulator/uracil phosphoribosyltransferase PyrR [Pseudactinotalea sp. HY158]|uniref:bifunctional pyr operon transcriptional regulator/uracil phosphoribosyltransferase PyrR n=1 Tax=Pseudactinotalea sp. HY158 TaxID=2654547 RepID=UPI00129C115C|nr:bifunctional pyr operon transcriptional regulator/uracil phosphoribosyltransferase PyrR [Pseudactinotalea sp. HY158]QGH69368.1 bifunctional pyr operon transcriptional regulator/uracil phosphoribosyltransferase PyrR [Pseudactinotalea sp. HY158]
MTSDQGTLVLSDGDIARALTRISHEIIERNRGADGVVLLGIPTRGVPLAARLGERLLAADGRGGEPNGIVGTIDITLHRDDLRSQPTRALTASRIPAGGIDEKIVVLVDDVLYSGRTVRAALDAVSDLGRPRAVQLAVLVDRGHRELPIRADFIGKNLPTARTERVQVRLSELDGDDRVVLHP